MRNGITEESTWDAYNEPTYEKPLFLRVFLTLVKLWVTFCILGIAVGVVVIIGIQQAVDTGEDNFVTKGIVYVMEKISGEKIDVGIAGQFSPPEETPQDAPEALETGDRETVEERTGETEESPENASESAEETMEDPAEPEENTTWYLTLRVAEGSYFDIMGNLNYITHDVLDKRLIPLVTDERVHLAGIVEFDSDYIIVMVTVDRDGFLTDGTYDEQAAEEAVYEQAEIVLTEWFSIIGG